MWEVRVVGFEITHPAEIEITQSRTSLTSSPFTHHIYNYHTHPSGTNACALAALTSDQHDEDREDLLRVSVGGHVAEAHAGQAAEGEVEGRDVLGLDGGAAVDVRHVVVLAGLTGQLVQPANPRLTALRHVALHVSDGIPDARQPMGDEGEGRHQEQEHGSAILGVPVQLAGHPHQAKQPRRF